MQYLIVHNDVDSAASCVERQTAVQSKSNTVIEKPKVESLVHNSLSCKSSISMKLQTHHFRMFVIFSQVLKVSLEQGFEGYST
jgi:hypothetical protein